MPPKKPTKEGHNPEDAGAEITERDLEPATAVVASMKQIPGAAATNDAAATASPGTTAAATPRSHGATEATYAGTTALSKLINALAIIVRLWHLDPGSRAPFCPGQGKGSVGGPLSSHVGLP